MAKQESRAVADTIEHTVRGLALFCVSVLFTFAYSAIFAYRLPRKLGAKSFIAPPIAYLFVCSGFCVLTLSNLDYRIQLAAWAERMILAAQVSDVSSLLFRVVPFLLVAVLITMILSRTFGRSRWIDPQVLALSAYSTGFIAVSGSVAFVAATTWEWLSRSHLMFVLIWLYVFGNAAVPLMVSGRDLAFTRRRAHIGTGLALISPLVAFLLLAVVTRYVNKTRQALESKHTSDMSCALVGHLRTTALNQNGGSFLLLVMNQDTTARPPCSMYRDGGHFLFFEAWQTMKPSRLHLDESSGPGGPVLSFPRDQPQWLPLSFTGGDLWPGIKTATDVVVYLSGVPNSVSLRCPSVPAVGLSVECRAR